MSVDDSNDRRMNRDQKNIQMGEFYRKELLPEIAKSRYGSEHKQGQVVEDALDLLTGIEDEDSDVVSMISDIHASVATGQTTHPQGSSQPSSTSDDEEDGEGIVAELERKAEASETIDPEDHDLKRIKGGRGIDRAAIVAQAMLSTPTDLDINSIKEFCRREVGYSPNRARDLAKEVMWELEDELYNPVPAKDWVNDQVEEDLRNDRNNARKGGEGMSEAKYRRELGSSVEAYAGARDDLPSDGPYADPSEAADAVYEAFNTLLKTVKSSGTHKSRRAKAVIQEIWARTDDEVRDTKPTGSDSTLKFIVATNDDLKDAVRGGD